MSIWQEEVGYITIWTSTSSWYVLGKKEKIFKDQPNVLGIADDILIVGYDIDGKDHGRMLKWVM